MKKIMLVGRSGAGKTTLTQAMKGKKISYHKTQYINNYDVIIDTPGEYAENKTLARALVIYSYEADVVGLLMSAVEDYSLYSPNIVSMATRPVIGIVTQIDRENARVDLATMWLELAGCKKIFYVNSIDGEGVGDILNYLREDGDVLPWEREPDGAEAAAEEKDDRETKPDGRAAQNGAAKADREGKTGSGEAAGAPVEAAV